MDRGFRKPTPTKKRLRGLTRSLAALFFAFGLVSGCGQSPRSTASASTEQPAVAAKTHQTWFSSCPSCSLMSKPQNFSHLQAVTNERVALMSFALVVDGALGIDVKDSQAVGQYYGRAVLLGRWRITQISDHLLCGAPAGDYIVRPLTPSYMTSGAISGGTYEAIGPTRIVFRLQSAVVASANIQAGRMSFTAVLESVNNNSCGIALSAN